MRVSLKLTKSSGCLVSLMLRLYYFFKYSVMHISVVALSFLMVKK